MGRKRKAPCSAEPEKEAEEAPAADPQVPAQEPSTSAMDNNASEEAGGPEYFRDKVFVIDSSSFSSRSDADKLLTSLFDVHAQPYVPPNASTMTRYINSRAEFFVVEDANRKPDDYPKALRNKKNVKVVTAEWVFEAMKQHKNVDDPAHFLHPFDQPPAAAAAAAAAAEETTASEKVDPPPAKRQCSETPESAASEPDSQETGPRIPEGGIEPFKDKVFVFDCKAFPDAVYGPLASQLEELGGEACIPSNASVITRTINSRADYFVVANADKKPDSYPKALRANTDVKIVLAEWISESWGYAKNVEKPEYELHPFDPVSTPAPAAAPAADASAQPPAKSQRGQESKAVKTEADDVDDGTKDSDVEQKKKLVVKGKAAVDQECSIASTSRVVEDNGIVYDCMLNQTNIEGNNNKFYVIQALQSDSGGQYYCWTRWGRVGERGQFKLMPCQTMAMAISMFGKKFSEKTGNVFAHVKKGAPFQPRSGKYTMIEIDYGNDKDDEAEDAAKKVKKDAEAKPEAESKLDKRVQELIKLIFDMKMMESVMKELEFDCKKQPLGKLTKDQIKKGYEVLTEIEAEMKKKSPAHSRLVEMTNRFYTLIPHNFGRVRPPVINSSEMLKRKMQMLEALADIEIAAHIVEETGKDNSEFVNQLDANYAKLHTDIVPVETDSEEYKLIAKYVKNSHPRQTPGIVNVFKIRRDSDEKRFEEKKGLGNRMLLWHGSRLTNYVGILSQGLRIAPPEAPCSGYRFGKGIYFADLAQLSSRYCRAWGGQPFIMLLCDVALGKTADLKRDQFMTTALPGTDSTKALGTIEPDPAENVVRPDGVVVPCGKILENGNKNVSCFEHQYIVYDVAQCRLQYLIQFV